MTKTPENSGLCGSLSYPHETSTGGTKSAEHCLTILVASCSCTFTQQGWLDSIGILKHLILFAEN